MKKFVFLLMIVFCLYEQVYQPIMLWDHQKVPLLSHLWVERCIR